MHAFDPESSEKPNEATQGYHGKYRDAPSWDTNKKKSWNENRKKMSEEAANSFVLEAESNKAGHTWISHPDLQWKRGQKDQALESDSTVAHETVTKVQKPVMGEEKSEVSAKSEDSDQSKETLKFEGLNFHEMPKREGLKLEELQKLDEGLISETDTPRASFNLQVPDFPCWTDGPRSAGSGANSPLSSCTKESYWSIDFDDMDGARAPGSCLDWNQNLHWDPELLAVAGIDQSMMSNPDLKASLLRSASLMVEAQAKLAKTELLKLLAIQRKEAVEKYRNHEHENNKTQKISSQTLPRLERKVENERRVAVELEAAHLKNQNDAMKQMRQYENQYAAGDSGDWGMPQNQMYANWPGVVWVAVPVAFDGYGNQTMQMPNQRMPIGDTSWIPIENVNTTAMVIENASTPNSVTMAEEREGLTEASQENTGSVLGDIKMKIEDMQ